MMSEPNDIKNIDDIFIVDCSHNSEPLDSERVKSTLDAYFKVRPFVDEQINKIDQQLSVDSMNDPVDFLFKNGRSFAEQWSKVEKCQLTLASWFVDAMHVITILRLKEYSRTRRRRCGKSRGTIK